MSNDSLSQIAVKHTENFDFIMAQIPHYQAVMLDHLRIYQELSRIGNEMAIYLYRCRKNHPLAKRWLATTQLLIEKAPFHNAVDFIRNPALLKETIAQTDPNSMEEVRKKAARAGY